MQTSIIKKTYRSETAHRVLNAVSSRCKYNIHGHSYLWEINIEGTINQETGMVFDFKELQPIKDFIDKFDHAMVLWEKEDDEIKQFYLKHYSRIIIMKQNCTAENMAKVVYKFVSDWLQKINNIRYTNFYCTQVDVWETTTGCGVAVDYDENDVLIYLHDDDK